MSIDVGANNASRMLGPIVGGILLATLGIGGALTVSVARLSVGVRGGAPDPAIATQPAPSIGAGVARAHDRRADARLRRDRSIERNHGRSP